MSRSLPYSEAVRTNALDQLVGATRTKKTGPLDERIASLQETASWLSSKMRFLPISRVGQIGRLDQLGWPTFCAVTPLAKDLTSHLGKGTSLEAARVSAIMEAVERLSAERAPLGCKYGSFAQLRSNGALDPRGCVLDDDLEFHDEQALHWAQGLDLMNGEAVWLPRDLVVSPPIDGWMKCADTNGLASGNSILEAVVHGLCEVVERDALSVLSFADRFGDNAPTGTQSIHIDSLDAFHGPIVEAIVAQGFELTLESLDNDWGIPVLRATIWDDHFPQGGRLESLSFHGFGCHPHPELAARRALTEAVQSRIGMTHAGRDSYNLTRTPWRRSAQARLKEARHRAPSLRFSDLAGHPSSDLRDELDWMLRRLSVAGVERVVVFDLTQAEWEIPVVRVRVPGLSTFVTNRRRWGQRCLKQVL